MTLRARANQELSWDGFESIGTCPCGGSLFANPVLACVRHSVPCCQPFISLDALEFMQYVRRSRGITDEEVNRMDN